MVDLNRASGGTGNDELEADGNSGRPKTSEGWPGQGVVVTQRTEEGAVAGRRSAR